MNKVLKSHISGSFLFNYLKQHKKKQVNYKYRVKRIRGIKYDTTKRDITIINSSRI